MIVAVILIGVVGLGFAATLLGGAPRRYPDENFEEQGDAVVACKAHNLEVAGSIPAPATSA